MKINTIVITIIGVVGAVTTIYLFLLPRPKTFPPEHLISLLPSKGGEITSRKGNSYLISDVSVIPMNKDTVLTHQFVLIDSGRIKAISSYQDSANIDSPVFVIDGTGKYLIPGLADLLKTSL